MKLRLNLFQLKEQLKETTVEAKGYRFSLEYFYSGEAKLSIREAGYSSRDISIPLDAAIKLRDYLNEYLGPSK